MWELIIYFSKVKLKILGVIYSPLSTAFALWGHGPDSLWTSGDWLTASDFVSTFVPFHKVLTVVQNGSVAGQ